MTSPHCAITGRDLGAQGVWREGTENKRTRVRVLRPGERVWSSQAKAPKKSNRIQWNGCPTYHEAETCKLTEDETDTS